MKELLPVDFLQEIKQILTDNQEYEAFVESYESEKSYGLRYNPLLNERDSFIEEMPFSLEKIPWARDGYYVDKKNEPGKHPYHEAGAYYIQEPSAMAVADLLEAKPGEMICDLCAAPGGKSSQIAAAMAGEGLLVANEIIPSRARILSQNMERMGIRNAVVCNEPPERMSEFFPCFFDKILVDAPCSGEGMFRKNPEAIDEWSKEHVKMCGERQRFILEHAALMLKPGGVLVYSTCTFNRTEDEWMMEQFLADHHEFELYPIEAVNGVSEGLMAGTMRLWPHKSDGEGHFAARLRKKEGGQVNSVIPVKGEKRQELIKPYLEFAREYLKVELSGTFVSFGEELYLVPEQMRDLRGLKVVRPGLHLGTNKKNRFEPAHALAASLAPDEAKQSVKVDDAKAFLKGESFRKEESHKGWTLVCIGNYSMGWSKCNNGVYKNHYPKGLRLQF